MGAAVLVIGLGSIGTRHARVLAANGHRVVTVSRRGPGDFAAIAPALRGAAPDLVVVATETGDHRRVLADLVAADYRGRVLCEKPLFGDPTPLAHGFARLSVAYNLRHEPALQAFRRRLAGEPVLAAQIYVGQYLPEWRPSRACAEVYSATAALGGGALRDLSHELDYALWLFGPWRRCAALGGHWSALPGDSDDVFAILAALARCRALTLQVNYLDRRPHRELTVTTDSHTHSVDLIRKTLRTDREEPEVFPSDRDQVLALVHAAALSDTPSDLCTEAEGMAVLGLIDAAEQSARSGRFIVNGISREDQGS